MGVGMDESLKGGGGGIARAREPRSPRAVSFLPHPLRFCAITFGHVVIGVDHETLAHCRTHEHVHVRQYERWGPLFVPAYLLSSLIELLRGRRPYLDNRFEREAYGKTAAGGGGQRR